MKENTEYLEMFIIVDDTKFQQGQENLIFFQIFQNSFHRNYLCNSIYALLLKIMMLNFDVFMHKKIG